MQIKKDLDENANKEMEKAVDPEEKGKGKDSKAQGNEGEGKPCRYGNGCYNPTCRFQHEYGICRYTPCQNPACPYRHTRGQKAGDDAKSK